VHWLWQVLHGWWGGLGLGALLTGGFKRLFNPVLDWALETYDQKVWDVVKHPRFVPSGASGSNFGPPPVLKPIPYSAPEIAAKIKRRELTVRGSLKRLEKRGKVKETHEGWLVG
jgi:hypothetical protein